MPPHTQRRPQGRPPAAADRGAASGELTPTPGPRRALRWWVAAPAEGLLARLLADPDAVLAGPGSQPRPRVGRKRFYRLSPEPGAPPEPALYVKVFQARAGPLHWPGRLRRAKAWREARVAARVRQLGFDAVAPAAVGEERRAGLLVRSFCVTEERSGARDLRARLERDAPGPAARRRWLASFGRWQRALHDAGIDQDDTSPNNFLLEESAAGLRWTLIDFERCRTGRALGWPRRWRLLAKLARHELGATRAERLRALATYLGDGRGSGGGDDRRARDDGGRGDGRSGAGGDDRGDARAARAARRAAWSEIRAELESLALRAARHAARGAFSPGRHVARAADGWRVCGREQAPLLRLALAPREARAAWVLAHQLERLGLPALLPARLDAGGVAWVAPEPAPEPDAAARARAVARARRAFERCGRFATEPEWLWSARGPLLRDPRAFRLRRLAPLAALSALRARLAR